MISAYLPHIIVKPQSGNYSGTSNEVPLFLELKYPCHIYGIGRRGFTSGQLTPGQEASMPQV